MLDSRMVVTMGTCGFIPVWLSIICPGLGTSIPLFKLPMEKWFRSLFLGLFTCLRCTVVIWIVGSVRFSVLFLSVFAILTHPPISLVGNSIWSGCSVPVIWFLVIISPGEVVICLDCASIFSMQVSRRFAFPDLIVLLKFVQLFLSRQLFRSQFFNFIARSWFNFIACVWFNCFARNYTLIFLIFVKRDLTIFLKIFLSTIFFILQSYTITIDSKVWYNIEMCSTLFRIRFTSFLLLVTSINISLQLSVCCT